MKFFLYNFRSIRNWTFIGAKMEALLTVTWWLGLRSTKDHACTLHKGAAVLGGGGAGERGGINVA